MITCYKGTCVLLKHMSISRRNINTLQRGSPDILSYIFLVCYFGQSVNMKATHPLPN